MRQTFRRYNLILALILLPIVLTLLITSSLIEPLSGNMTRIGGYLESDYGWNKQQLGFDQPQFTKSLGDYDRYSDVVVLGDSFSKNTLWGWPNYFVDRTGLTLQFFHFDQGGYERIINSRTFAEKPPRLFIIESVENELKERLGSPAGNCPPPSSVNLPAMVMHPKGAATHAISRKRKTAAFNFDLAADYLGKAVPRLLGIETTDTLRVTLSRDDLFTNHRSDTLLAYNHSLDLRHWDENILHNIHCNLLALQRRVEANGTTHFIFMPIPAKLFAYSAYIQGGNYGALSVVAALAQSPSPNILRLDRFIPEQIAKGSVDFYLPNDTHWSSHGYQQVANYLIATLKEKKALH